MSVQVAACSREHILYSIVDNTFYVYVGGSGAACRTKSADRSCGGGGGSGGEGERGSQGKTPERALGSHSQIPGALCVCECVCVCVCVRER